MDSQLPGTGLQLATDVVMEMYPNGWKDYDPGARY